MDFIDHITAFRFSYPFTYSNYIMAKAIKHVDVYKVVIIKRQKCTIRIRRFTLAFPIRIE